MSVRNLGVSAAAQLLTKGYAIVPTSSSVNIEDLFAESNRFFDRRIAAADEKTWSATRPGEREPDVGLRRSTPDDSNHAGDPKDDKIHFMWSPDAADLLGRQKGLCVYQNPDTDTLWKKLSSLHQQNCLIAGRIASGLDQISSSALRPALEFTERGCRPYAAAATRVMRYRTGGGKPHRDKSFLTVHCGDLGGHLYAICPNTGEQINVSPPPGHVTVFPGFKAEIATQGQLKALVHGSYSEPGVERMAVVTFTHLVTDPIVFDAKTACEAGRAHFRVMTG